MLETDLRAFLLANAGVSALTKSISPEPRPQDGPLPAITFTRIDGQREYSLSGPSGLASPRIQLRSWAVKWQDARTLAEAIRAALEGFQGRLVANGTYVSCAMIADDRDGYHPESKLHVADLDFQISHQE